MFNDYERFHSLGYGLYLHLSAKLSSFLIEENASCIIHIIPDIIASFTESVYRINYLVLLN